MIKCGEQKRSSTTMVVEKTRIHLNEWQQVRESDASTMHAHIGFVIKWDKSLVSYLKLNVDAAVNGGEILSEFGWPWGHGVGGRGSLLPMLAATGKGDRRVTIGLAIRGPGGNERLGGILRHGSKSLVASWDTWVAFRIRRYSDHLFSTFFDSNIIIDKGSGSL
nr:uncharacterized protein LOC109174472 [Ipomoea batatas]